MKKVIIYSTPTCSYCKLAKEFFKEKNVVYEEYNVAADVARREEMMDKSGQLGVPVIAIADPAAESGEEEQIIIGFDKRALAAALELN